MAHNIPRPGTPVRGSKTGKPIMALFDLLGRSWSLGIVWQLSQGPMTFRQLQQSCETVSPTVLNRRLKELSASGFLNAVRPGINYPAQAWSYLRYLNLLGPGRAVGQKGYPTTSNGLSYKNCTVCFFT